MSKKYLSEILLFNFKTVFATLVFAALIILIVVAVRVLKSRRKTARRMEYTDGYFMISTSEESELVENDELNSNNSGNKTSGSLL
jgi:hypothetical protein